MFSAGQLNVHSDVQKGRDDEDDEENLPSLTSRDLICGMRQTN